MGSSLCCGCKKGESRERKVTMVGLSGAGKTAILYRLRTGELVTTCQTHGYNIETITHSNKEITVYDLGDTAKFRSFWKYSYNDTGVLVFVLDSSDQSSFIITQDRWDEETPQDLLHSVLKSDDLNKNIPLLIWANKQDLPSSMNKDEIIQQLKLESFMDDRQWYIQECSAQNGKGLREGMDWITSHFQY